MTELEKAVDKMLKDMVQEAYWDGMEEGDGDYAGDGFEEEAYTKEAKQAILALIQDEVRKAESKQAEKHLVDCLHTGICTFLQKAQSINLEKDNYVKQLSEGKE